MKLGLCDYPVIFRTTTLFIRSPFVFHPRGVVFYVYHHNTSKAKAESIARMCDKTSSQLPVHNAMNARSRSAKFAVMRSATRARP